MKTLILAALTGWAPLFLQDAQPVAGPDLVDELRVVLVDPGFDDTTPGWGVRRFAVIQEAVDAVPADSWIFVRPGTYVENVTIQKRIGLIGSGPASTVIDGGGLGAVVGVQTDGVTLARLHFRNGSDTNFGGGVLVSSSGNLIAHNRFSKNGFGITITPGTSANTVRENFFEAGAFVGVVLDGSVDARIEDNAFADGGILVNGPLPEHWDSHTIEGNALAGLPIRYERNLAGPLTLPLDFGQLILVHGSDLVLQGGSFADSAVPVQIGFSSDVDVLDCVFEGRGPSSVLAASAQRLRILRNELQRGGINLSGTDCRIRNNRIRSGSILVHGSDSSGNTIVGNELVDDGAIGVFFASNTLVEGNVVSGAPEEAILLMGSDDNTITANLLFDSGAGITLRQDCNDNVVAGNVLSGNPDHGIRLDGLCDANELYDNLIAGSLEGVRLTFLDRGNTIRDNVLAGHQTGFHLPYGGNESNTLYRNDLGNERNAYDENDNEWNVGQPVCGNYWSDYHGSDADDDGIGDVPHPIPGGISNDLLPLVDPSTGLLWANGYALAPENGWTIELRLHAGASLAGEPYQLHGSMSGVFPGTMLPGGLLLPLVSDAFTADVLAGSGSPPYEGFAGTLDADGEATARLRFGFLSAALVDEIFTFAYAVGDPAVLVSNPVLVTVSGPALGDITETHARTAPAVPLGGER